MININIDKKLSDKVNVHIASIEAKVKTKESDKELLELINKKCEEIKENINKCINGNNDLKRGILFIQMIEYRQDSCYIS